jgi:hypothetical protein
MNTSETPSGTHNQPTQLVCGFGRCGTSLAIQMLAAGGFPVAGEWPDFGPHESDHDQGTGVGGWDRLRDKTVNLLDPHRCTPLPRGPVRAVWRSRDYRQPASRQAKFGNITMGLPNDRRVMKFYEKSSAKDEPVAKGLLRRWTGSEVPTVRFEDMILRPIEASRAICQAVGLDGADPQAMARPVRTRGVGCYPGLLEIDLTIQGAPR